MRIKFGPKMPSNANLFDKRGDPWVSKREGIRDFGREPSVLSGTENPEMDSFTRARMAKPRFNLGPDKPIFPRPVEGDEARRRANIARKMHKELNAAEKLVIIPEPVHRDANRAANGVPYQPRPGTRLRKK